MNDIERAATTLARLMVAAHRAGLSALPVHENPYLHDERNAQIAERATVKAGEMLAGGR